MSYRGMFKKVAGGLVLSFLAACTAQESENLEVDEQVILKDRPNVVVIVADDLGFTDLGAYGGEIPTPNIDSLVQTGALFTNYHSNATCAPSRAMLLSGMDNHRLGFGLNPSAARRIPEARDHPAFNGVLPDNFQSIAARLKAEGYYSVMAGKWHLGKAAYTTPEAFGFERSFHLQNGGGSHFSDATGTFRQDKEMFYFEDGERINELPSDFFSSEAYISKVIGYLEDQEVDSKNPFFAYVAFTAPHWPLQAPAEWMDRFEGDYDEGWEAVRLKRIARAQELGIIPQNAPIPPFPKAIGSWDDLTVDERAYETRRMELYAAMIAHMDHQVGRLISYLKKSGEFENTVIVFVSDNGPEGNDVANGIGDNSIWVPETFDLSFENMGKPQSYTTLGRGWAHVSSGPYARYKSFMHEGGVRVPAIISYSDQTKKSSMITDLVSVMDITPTLLDVSGAKPITDADGSSFLPLLLDPSTQDLTRRELVMEIYGNRGVWKDNWKLTWDWSQHQWQLFDLAVDPGEQRDVSKDHPQIVQSLLEQWQAFLDTYDLPAFDRDYGYGRYADQVRR